MATQLWAMGLVLGAGLIGGLAPIFLKRGSSKLNLKDLRSIILNWELFTGIGIYGLTTILFIPALKGGELSILYPLVGLSYVWVCVYSSILLKEKMNLLKWAGIGVIILGVTFIGIGA